MLLHTMGFIKMVEILNQAVPFLILSIWCIGTYYIVDLL